MPEPNYRTYGYCKACGNLVYREPGKLHGDGQQDADDSPVWLLLAAPTDRDYDNQLGGLEEGNIVVENVLCGCND